MWNIANIEFYFQGLLLKILAIYMLWFNFLFGLKFFKPVWFLFSFVSDYDNEQETKENKNQTGLKKFKPNIKLNHKIYMCN